MNGRHPVPSELVGAVVAVLRDVANWPRWAPGIRSVEALGGSLRLQVGGPRPFRCDCRAREIDGGIALELEQGGPAGLAVTLSVHDGSDAAIGWTLDLQPGLGIPDVLWRTLEREVVPAALTALVEQASRRAAEPPAVGRRSDPAFG